MPTRYRPCSVICNVFVLIVLFMIGFIYYVTIVLVWAPRVEGKCNTYAPCKLSLTHSLLSYRGTKLFKQLIYGHVQYILSDANVVLLENDV